MGTIYADIRFARGLEENLPSLDEGKPAITRDTKRVFVGSDEGNVELAKQKDIDDHALQLANSAKKTYGIVNIMEQGANCDGVTDDTLPVRASIALAETLGWKVLIPGVAVITGEIEVKKSIVIEGIGSGGGYTSAGITGYIQKSGFLVKGTGTKRVRTRRSYRASSSDPQDNPLSVALNIQAEGVSLKNLSLFLDFDRTDNTKANYGSDWDVGIFVGCRTQFKTENVHVMGYWREASFYYDVTHATNLPRFNDLSGAPYDNTFNVSGGDGCVMINSMAWGGKWGIFVAGAIVGAGNYYDETLGTAVSDFRGTFGFSDFTTYSCSIYGTDHHSLYRRDKATGTYLTDSAGGSMFVDGRASNASNAVWGHRHFSTRFASFEPYRVKLDHAARVQFYGCHIEQRSGADRKNQDETTVLFDNTDTYGYITGTTNTDNIIGMGLNIPAIDSAFMPSTVRVHNMYPSGTSTGSKTSDPFLASYFQSVSGELDLRSADTSSDIRFRQGSTSIGFIGQTTGWRPNTDGVTPLGASSRRWSQVYSNNNVLNPITSATAVNNSFFVDSADNLPKFKNSSGVVKIINLT